MVQISYNQREKVLPSSDVPVIIQARYRVVSRVDENGISKNVTELDDSSSVLDLPFRTFSMQSYNDTGEINRLSFISPKSVTSFDVIDRISGDLNEVVSKVDYMQSMQSVVESIKNDNVE